MHVRWLFSFRNKLLESMGLTERDDQKVFYLTMGVSLYKYARLSYKNYLLRLYIKETDPTLKIIIGGRFPFQMAELRGAQVYLNRYGKNARMWLLFCPLCFFGYEFIKRGPRFWLWKSDINA